MKSILASNFDKYRFDGVGIDLHNMFKDFTDLENISDEEQEFIDAYFSSIQQIQRINSRQVSALAFTTVEALVCMGRATADVAVRLVTSEAQGR